MQSKGSCTATFGRSTQNWSCDLFLPGLLTKNIHQIAEHNQTANSHLVNKLQNNRPLQKAIQVAPHLTMSNIEKRRKKTKLFTNDVRSLLYAYGDVEDPLPETVDAVEDIVTNYIIDLCHDASAFAKVTRRQKIRVDDFKFALRKDPIKFGRLLELLDLQKSISEARKQFDNSEGKSLKNTHYEDDDEDVGEDGTQSTTNPDGSVNTASRPEKKERKNAKKNGDPNRPKRKYTKSGKERKPYKKRAKKTDSSSAPVITPAAPSMAM